MSSTDNFINHWLYQQQASFSSSSILFPLLSFYLFAIHARRFRSPSSDRHTGARVYTQEADTYRFQFFSPWIVRSTSYFYFSAAHNRRTHGWDFIFSRWTDSENFCIAIAQAPTGPGGEVAHCALLRCTGSGKSSSFLSRSGLVRWDARHHRCR